MGTRALLFTIASIAVFPAVAQAALVFQAQAADYDPTTGTLVTDVGPDAIQATETLRPALVAGQTANGSAVLRFDGGDALNFEALSSASGNYTVFAFIRPADNSSAASVISGDNGSVQYRIGGDGALDRQQLIRRGQANLGTGAGDISNALFSSINVATGPTSTSFRLNGADDGSGGASTYTAGLSHIGSGAATASEAYTGDIAEIRVYDTLMDASERAAVEAELNATYVPEPASLGILSLGAFGLLARRRRHCC